MTSKLKLLDLFSGIGGFSLGLERSGGFETVAFCEIEKYPRQVLTKHWPKVPCYDDIRTLTAARLAADGIAVDAICGGFPCQDISTAGRGAGIGGERSGLWKEYARLIDELRPRYAIMENVAVLRSRGLDVVLGDLAEIGYDAEWHCIPASAVGAPHQRDRIWIVAHPTRERVEGSGASREQEPFVSFGQTILGRNSPACGTGHWSSEPGMARLVDGIPDRVQRVKALGNSLVPQIPELIGHAIIQHMMAHD
jgi:DNA (cytosine-5)-methyltransferase 1